VFLCLLQGQRAAASAKAGDYIGINQWVDDWDNVHMAARDTAKVARWIRWYTFMEWCTTKPGQFQFAPTYVANFNFDDWFKVWKNAGLKVDLCLMHSATYASSYRSNGNHGQNPEHYPPYGASVGLSPEDYKAYAGWCSQIASRYGKITPDTACLRTPDKKGALALVDALEIWNEPNATDPGWGFWRSDTCKPPQDQGWCEIEARQYAAMLKASTEAIRLADPGMQVTGGVTAGWDQAYFDLLKNQGSLQGVDGLNFHCYFGTPNSQGPGHAPEYQHALSDLCRKVLAWRDKNLPAKAIWMTELGYDAYDRRLRPTVAFGATLDEQANYLVRSFVIAAPYVDHFFWFIASDARNDMATVQFENCGIVKKYGTRNPKGIPGVVPKPAYWAMALMNAELGGLDYQATLADDAKGAYAFLFKDPLSSKAVLVAWCARLDQKTDTGFKVSYSWVLPPRTRALSLVRFKEGVHEGERQEFKKAGTLALPLTETPIYLELIQE
jgi:hypothetical protein